MTEKQAQKWIAERDKLGEALREFDAQFTGQIKTDGFCKKCGVSSEFHMNLYCRKVQDLNKGIQRLKQQLAEAKREVAK